jgi:uncharacterized protein YcaQ
MAHDTIEISNATARRYILGRQGLWPGRRWRGLEGAAEAMRTMEHLQLDPLVLVARAQDLMLHARVLDYRPDDWARLTYGERRFFDWGGWLAVRPMEELPHWRVIMRRERDHADWVEVAAEHGPAIEEMRVALRERGEISNRDYTAEARTRVDDYRGRKDSSLALHYLWRIGDAMVTRRERFERVYAPTDAVAPAELIHESADEAAEDFLLAKLVAWEGLSKLKGVSQALKRTVAPAELRAWRERRLADGTLVEVRAEGWSGTQLALGADADLLRGLDAGTVPAAWAPLETTTEDEVTWLAPLDPVSARGRAKTVFGFEYTWEIYTPVHRRRWGPHTMPILWGDRLVARVDPRLDRATGTLVINGLWLEDPALAKDEAFATAMRRGAARFRAFHEARRLDVSAVPRSLRRLLRAR